MAQRDMIATAGFKYKTRRLMPGEPFQASDRDARVLIAIKKAKEGRVPGRIAPPPRPVAEKIQQQAPQPAKDKETFAGFLDRSVKDIEPDLADQSGAQLAAILGDEQAGKSRKSLIAAIEAEIDSRGA